MQEYIKTDQQLHWLSKVLTKANRAFVPAKEDDSHTSLSFDSIGGRLFGRWINGPEGLVMLTLNLQKRAFEWLNEKQSILEEVAVPEKSMKQLEENVSRYPYSLKIKTDTFFSPLHFEIPGYGIESIGKDDLSDEGLQQWTFFRALANEACLEMLGYLQKDSEIRIWPHHFDTGLYAGINKGLGLGFGLAMMDSMVELPYFYLAGYGEGVNVSGLVLPGLSAGHWETTGPWKGAVLPLDRLSGKTYTEMVEDIRSFIREVSDWYMHITEKQP